MLSQPLPGLLPDRFSHFYMTGRWPHWRSYAMPDFTTKRLVDYLDEPGVDAAILKAGLINAGVASTEQGAKADSALQRASNLSDVSNPGATQDNIQSGAVFADRQAASIANIAVRNWTLRTQVFATASVQSGGGANHRRASLTDLTGVPSQAYFRSQDRYMPDGSTDATNGGYWVLDEIKPSVSMFGAVSGDTAASLLTAFQAAIDYMPSGGGTISIPTGDFSALDPSSLNVGNKAITWDCGGRAVTLPGTMKGIIKTSGVFSLPEASMQANRNVRVHDLLDMGDIIAVAGLRQYGIHIHGFLHDSGDSPSELEARGYSFDLGTNQNSIVDCIRGMKGRVYADGGKSNIRSIYGFAESVDGSGHSGPLTGLIGTVYKNGGNSNADGDSFAVRGHADAGTNGCFQAAGAKGGETNSFSFAYSVRTGSGQPAMPTVASFVTHGGANGAMFLGYRSNLDLTQIMAIEKSGKIQAPSFRSGSITVADGAVATITPPSLTEGILVVDTANADQLWATVKIRASGTHLCRPAGTNGTLIGLSTTALTGATGASGNITISCNNGTVQFENRTGSSRTIVYNFMTL